MSTGTAKTKWILELQDEVTADLKSLDGVVENTQKDFESFNDTVDVGMERLQDFVDSFKDLKKGMATGDVQSIKKGWEGVAEGIKGATKAALSFLATPLGLGIAAIAGIALATKEWAKYNKEAKEANIITQQITRLSGDELDHARVRAKALEQTFGVDFERVLELAKNNVKAFGISYNEALDNISDGLVRGGSVNQEYMDSIREYPRLFAQAGFSMSDFQRIVNTGIDEGIYSDKLPDAIKEFGISMREQTTSTRDALENAFGKQFTDRLFTNITEGSQSPKEALIEIVNEANRVGLNAQQSAQLTADVFRGAGEDVGGLAVIIDGVTAALIDETAALTPLQQNIKEVTDATTELEMAQNRALKSDNYAYMANQADLAWIKVKTLWYDGIDTITNLVTEWADTSVVELMTFITTVRSIPEQFKLSFLEIKKEAADVIGVFGNLGGVAGKLFSLDFEGALEDAKKFKNDLKKEVDDVKNTGANALVRAGTLNQAIRNQIRDEINGRREGAAAAATLDTAGAPEDGSEVGGRSVAGRGIAGGLSRQGSGGAGRTINMTLNIENIFKVADGAIGEVEDIADRVVSRITDRLRDSTIALG